MKLSLAQLQQLAAQANFPDPSLAAAIAMAESQGNPNAANVHDAVPGVSYAEASYGLWQINTLAHPQYDEQDLYTPSYNAQAAYQISNGGTDWTPWSTYTKGYYKAYYSGPGGSSSAPWYKRVSLTEWGLVVAATAGAMVLVKVAQDEGLLRRLAVR